MHSCSTVLFCLFLLFAGSLEYHIFMPIIPPPVVHFPERRNLNLRFVAAVWRHGSRAPLLDPFVKSPEGAKARWTEGMGNLTKNGENEMLLLGRLLRRRYHGLLRGWTKDSLSITSSAIPRAIRSGELVFKGMFPETITFKDCKGCVKIPIEVIPAENDTMLDLNYANCPYPYRPPLVSCVEIPGKERLMKKHEDVLTRIAKIIKRKPRTMDNYGLHDALLSYRHHGSMKSHLPDWARSDDFYNALSKLISESKTAYVMCQEYQLLRGSNLFKRIADQLSEAAKTNKSEPSLKFAGYSAHDFTLIALLVDWDFYIAELDPQFGACIMVELHKIRRQYVVQVWYKQGHYKGPFPVKIKDCDMNCPLEKFVKLAEQLSSIDISNRCAQFEANNLRYVPTVH